MKALAELQAIAAEALAALDTGNQIQPFSSRTSSFNLEPSNGRSEEDARGPWGTACGSQDRFYDRTAWVDYNVHEPTGPMSELEWLPQLNNQLVSAQNIPQPPGLASPALAASLC
jgi:hypothetical protein